jgi:hypothetical protein
MYKPSVSEIDCFSPRTNYLESSSSLRQRSSWFQSCAVILQMLCHRSHSYQFIRSIRRQSPHFVTSHPNFVDLLFDFKISNAFSLQPSFPWPFALLGRYILASATFWLHLSHDRTSSTVFNSGGVHEGSYRGQRVGPKMRLRENE